MTESARATRVVGKGVQRVDSPERVTGQAVYGADHKTPGTLYAKVVRSPYASARIRSIDVRAASRLPGVRAVVTSADFPHIEHSMRAVGGEITMTPRDQRRMQMAEDRVFYHGQAVAAIAADDLGTAEAAAALVSIDYEPLAPVVDVEKAVRPGSPLVHDDLYTWEFAGGLSDNASNIARRIELDRGNLDEGFAEAEVIIERRFRGGTVHQGYLEPQASTVEFDANGHLTVYTSSQINFNLRDTLAIILGLPQEMITVVPLEIGGGFGGKAGLGIEFVTALLALKARRTTKLVLTREEVFRATGPTCAHVIDIAIGAKRDGTVVAFKATYLLDTGAMTGFTHSATAAMTGASHYKFPHLHVDAYDVVTNKPVAMAYRAPSGPIGNFPTEVVMDELAETLGIDPIDLRIMNVTEDGGPLPNGLSMAVWGLKNILVAARVHPAWTDPLPPGRGRGFAAAYWGGATLTSAAEIVANPDATFSVITGSVDLTGTRTTMAQIAAEELGVNMEQVHVGIGDTDSVGHTDGSFGSRTTLTTGTAVMKAARDVLAQLRVRAGELLRVEAAFVDYEDQTFSMRDNPDKRVTLLEVCSSVGNAGNQVKGMGNSTGLPGAPTAAASIAEVEVDPETGRSEIKRFTIFQDPGNAINPTAVEGQMQGGAAQGIGWALWEVYDIDEATGIVRNANFLDYRVPTTLDVPMIDAEIVATPNPNGPYGARGVGEIPIVTPVAAVANAIHDATGVRIYETPLTPERVFWAIRESQGSR
ncbi:MAG: xanthine dehydrogenase family protein molybdopterin-binding subunit [Chloroflexi bacterium]|nr:xanthine dehydrogenase family protein molybdopterin-binding subunit [Chloroflexota bacterium]